ncbi:hypothetical protein AB0C97_36775 [Streptomyces goshikiensis]|uniref:hypothetical protein n=1 Tax=Streptomyces goshikiensis TaxID=1942 RepID=UPI00340CDB02
MKNTVIAPGPTLAEQFAVLTPAQALDRLDAAAEAATSTSDFGQLQDVLAACRRLQAGRGRHLPVSDRNLTGAGAALAELIDGPGGFQLLGSDVIRQHLAPLLAADFRQYEMTFRSQGARFQRRSHAEVLNSLGLAVFPYLPSGRIYVLAYERGLLLGRYLDALTAGEGAAEVRAEILAEAQGEATA